MSPTKLTLRYPKAARHEDLSSLQSAQVNHGSQFLLLRQADLGRATSSQSIDHFPVEVRRGHASPRTAAALTVHQLVEGFFEFRRESSRVRIRSLPLVTGDRRCR